MIDVFFVGFFAGLLATAIVIGVSTSNIDKSRQANCDNFGAFMVDDVKYECRRVEK